MSAETKLKYQVALFGDFSHVTPDEETLKKCIENFFTLGFMPTPLQEFNGQTSKVEARLGFQSIRNGIVVNILSNRMDVFCNPFPGSNAAGLSLRDFGDESKKIIDKIISVFSLNVRRAGYVTETFLKPLDDASLEKVKKLMLNADFNPTGNLTPKEWSIRLVSPVVMEGIASPVNLITNFARSDIQMGDQSGQKEFTTIHVTMDVNMPMEKASFTMDAALISGFIDNSLELQHTVLKNVREIAYG
ncbi:hypothetical protein CHR29_20975 [Pseudomonas monteilii]|uniref:hypothetical protein n=1 Tax=Pseudomonas TaxID=286 RepID=UPI000EF6CAEA|nr:MULTISPECIES: hypothetical protein [Pseudomonas]AYN17490.1 hypothetical protein CHR29_20975 [Pseudomonas monteilii]AYN98891.1 hypothetical protein D8767_07875 [Pseudomonas sp. LTGT-11-2Z]MCE0876830.1 hypothetical protein [Pseudomonas monteilii]MCE0926749.1 hypothetical protein [Pseudomonas monteilii]MCE0932313.1 hypothetical protein [Pseudomonas monteilii]